jgi:hypothetical protein
MYFQHLTIGIQLAFNNVIERIYKFNRILMYYLFPRSRDWINYTELYQRDSDILEMCFLSGEVQLYYVNFGKSGVEYYLSTYTTLIDDC